jgi:hypothetical protein
VTPYFAAIDAKGESAASLAVCISLVLALSWPSAARQVESGTKAAVGDRRDAGGPEVVHELLLLRPGVQLDLVGVRSGQARCEGTWLKLLTPMARVFALLTQFDERSPLVDALVRRQRRVDEV